MLLRRYGSGYGLMCVKTDKDVPSDPIKDLVLASIEGSKLRTNIGAEVSFALPIEQSKDFPALFRKMESDSSLGLATFGLTQSSLEEVFLNLAELNDHSAETTGSNATSTDNPMKSEKEPFPKFECEPTFGGQFNAVLYQVMLQSIRYPLAVVYLVLNPLLMTFLATLVAPYFRVEPPAGINMLSVVRDGKAEGACAEHMWSGSLPVTDGEFGTAGNMYATCNELVEILQLETHTLAKHPYTAFCYNANGSVADWGIPANSISVLFNGTETYSARSSLSCVYNKLSASALAGTANEGGITTSYKVYESLISSNSLGGGAMMGFIASAFALLSGYYAEEQIRLRTERVKEMMLLCGLPRFTYWISYFFSHYLLFLLSWTLCYVLLVITAEMPGINENSAFLYFFLAMCAGPAIVLFGYVLSFVTDDILAAQQWLNEFLNLSFGLPFLILTFAVQDEDTRASLENFFGIIPGFSFYKALGVLETAVANGEPMTAGDLFDWDKGLTKFVCFLVFDWFLFSGLLYVIDTNLIGRLTGPKLDDAQMKDVGMDDDQRLLAEKIPAIEGATMDEKPNNQAHAHKLSKKYPLEGGGSVQAVRVTSVGVPPDTVLGLLGPNGAGKTTMMSMMSGIESINTGDAWINDCSINGDLTGARKLLGLCPQFDALMDNLTTREHLKIFAQIRGVPADVQTALIDRTIKDMDLTLKADERTSGYSGGNKRKLSVALSMVANPTVNFLDEPSTGMDPETRRFMWDYIASVREGRALILTTHSMEEADALCSNIGIMIRGELRALGSSQELKSQHGEGFQVMVRIGDEYVGDSTGAFGPIDDTMKGLTQSGTIKTETMALTMKRYEIPSEDSDLATIFETVQGAAEELGIVDFSVSQTTLEDVFLKFARLQS